MSHFPIHPYSISCTRELKGSFSKIAAASPERPRWWFVSTCTEVPLQVRPLVLSMPRWSPALLPAGAELTCSFPLKTVWDQGYEWSPASLTLLSSFMFVTVHGKTLLGFSYQVILLRKIKKPSSTEQERVRQTPNIRMKDEFFRLVWEQTVHEKRWQRGQ